MTHTVSSSISGNRYSRRQFIKTGAALGLSAAGMALLGGCGSPNAISSAATESLETTTIRVAQGPSLCRAPEFMAEDFLRTEGFTDVQTMKLPANTVVSAVAE